MERNNERTIATRIRNEGNTSLAASGIFLPIIDKTTQLVESETGNVNTLDTFVRTDDLHTEAGSILNRITNVFSEMANVSCEMTNVFCEMTNVSCEMTNVSSEMINDSNVMTDVCNGIDSIQVEIEEISSQTCKIVAQTEMFEQPEEILCQTGETFNQAGNASKYMSNNCGIFVQMFDIDNPAQASKEEAKPAKASKEVAKPAEESKESVKPAEASKNSAQLPGESNEAAKQVVKLKDASKPREASKEATKPDEASKEEARKAESSKEKVRNEEASEGADKPAEATKEAAKPAVAAKEYKVTQDLKELAKLAVALQEAANPSEASNETTKRVEELKEEAKRVEELKEADKPAEASKKATKSAETLKEAAKPAKVSKEAAKPAEVTKEAAKPAEVSKKAAKPAEVSKEAPKPAGAATKALKGEVSPTRTQKEKPSSAQVSKEKSDSSSRTSKKKTRSEETSKEKPSFEETSKKKLRSEEASKKKPCSEGTSKGKPYPKEHKKPIPSVTSKCIPLNVCSHPEFDESKCGSDSARKKFSQGDKILNLESIERDEPGEHPVSFTEFFDKMQSLTNSHLEKEFQRLNCDYNRIQYLIENFEDVKNLQLWKTKGKSEPRAANYERLFDQIDLDNKLDQLYALNIISRSIFWTPIRYKKNLAVRYMKRAEVFFRLDNILDAETDARRAIQGCEDQAIMWNAFEILGNFYKGINLHKRASSYFERAVEGLKDSDLPKETLAKYAVRISKSYKIVKGGKDEESKTEERRLNSKYEYQPVPLVASKVNKVFDCASNAVKLNVNEEVGRGLYAIRDIQPGEILIAEKAYVSGLLPDQYDKRCHHCFKILKTPRPCDGCARVWYCDIRCCEESKKKYHLKECEVMHLLVDKALGLPGQLCYRVLMKVTWNKLKELRDTKRISTKINDDVEADLNHWNWVGKYVSQDYITLFKQVTNARHREFSDLFRRAVSSIYIMNCLKINKFFGNDQILLEDEIFVASIILRHMQQASCNAYEITEYDPECTLTPNVDYYEIAGGIYTTTSLTNHSCYPNAFRYYVGDVSIFRASKIIKPGEQIYDNYGMMVETMDLKSRQDHLRTHYMFQCKCPACAERWARFSELREEVRVGCPHEACKGIITYHTKMDKDLFEIHDYPKIDAALAEFPEMNVNKAGCPSCGRTEPIIDLLKKIKWQVKNFKQAVKYLKMKNLKSAFPIAKNFQTFADQIGIISPSFYISQCQEVLKRCFLLEGNKYSH